MRRGRRPQWVGERGVDQEGHLAECALGILRGDGLKHLGMLGDRLADQVAGPRAMRPGCGRGGGLLA
jgi:hypothetical protein